ncbi:MAG: hypothetical protein A4S16_03425 [Proteobacteria bacterium SG_bin6]|nr:MAG: hypothetical protein A4S16_03425 [Proteobacteria bacterium SG_bin6]
MAEEVRTSRSSLELFDSVPAWAIVHAATDDRNAPLIRQGEVVVVESDGRKGKIPTNGGLYLIEYVAPAPSANWGYERRTREIVQVRRTRFGWFCGGLRDNDGSNALAIADGPYRDEIDLAEKLLGPVVGLYRPVHSHANQGLLAHD